MNNPTLNKPKNIQKDTPMLLCMIYSNINKDCGPNQGSNNTIPFTSRIMLTTTRLDINNIPYKEILNNNIHNQPKIQVVHTPHSTPNYYTK